MTQLDLETICLNCNEDKSLCSCNSPEHQEITMPCGSSVAVSTDEPPLIELLKRLEDTPIPYKRFSFAMGSLEYEDENVYISKFLEDCLDPDSFDDEYFTERFKKIGAL